MADESIPQPESRPARERHEWTDPEDEIMYTVTVADGWMSGMGATPSRDLRIVQAPLVREILRLAAEVERGRDVHRQDASRLDAALKDQRDRIRRELLAALMDSETWAEFQEHLDRIVPEEG